MKYIVEKDLYDFKAWSGGKDTLDKLRAHNVIDEAEQYITMIMECREELPTDTEINDVLWFDRNAIYSYCGIYNSVYNIDEEDEDGEEE